MSAPTTSMPFGPAAGGLALLPWINVAVKTFAVLALACTATAAMRRAPASARHHVWLVALACALVMPVCSDRCNTTCAEWAARFFRYDAVNNTRTDDPDFDGLKNVAEYAFGSTPLAPGRAPTAWVRMSDGGVDYPAIRFRRRTGTSDLTVRVQVSTDLATWNDNTLGSVTTETTTVAQEDGMELATVRSNTPLGTQSQHLRVKVSVP